MSSAEVSPIASTLRVKSLATGKIYHIATREGGIDGFELKNILKNVYPDEYNDDYEPYLQIADTNINDEVVLPRDTEIGIHFSRYPTYVDHLLAKQPTTLQYVYKTVLALIGSLLMAVAAQMSFYLPFDDKVPVTFQTLAVLVVATMLGPVFGFLATACYLAEGAAGAPFFAGQSGGHGVLVGPTAGYLYGFLLASLITGTLAKFGFDRRFHTNCIAMIFGDVAIYLVGVPVLASFIGWGEALYRGILPFILGDGVKIIVATVILPLVWKLTAYVFNVRSRVIRFQDYFSCQS